MKIFFFESEIISIIKKHYANSIGRFKLIDADLIYLDGVNITKIDKVGEPAEEKGEKDEYSGSRLINEEDMSPVNNDRFTATRDVIFGFILELNHNDFLVEDDIYKYFRVVYKNRDWINIVESFNKSKSSAYNSIGKHHAYLFITALILLRIKVKGTKSSNQTDFYTDLMTHFEENTKYAGWKDESIKKFFASKKRPLNSMV